MCLSERVRECAPGEQWPFDTDFSQLWDCGQRMSGDRKSDWLLLSLGAGSKQDEAETLQLNHERRWDSWHLKEKNSIQGQRGGFIAQSFCAINIY